MSDEPTDELAEGLAAAGEDTPLADHPLTARRLEKLAELRGAGTETYPVRFERDATAAELQARHGDLAPGVETGRRVSVAGRLLNARSFGKLLFGVLQDGTGQIQLFVDRRVLGEEQFAVFGELDAGDWVGARGEVITTRKGELSVRVEEVSLLAKSLRPLPEKWHGLQDQERRYRQRYLDLIVNEEARRVAAIRVAVVKALRAAFETRGFVEVETPMLQVQPGGALARPFATHHNALGIDMYLRVAPELFLKRLVVGGMERVFEVNRNFRNEGVDATHNPEFTMLEAYQAFADYLDMMELVQEVIAEVAAEVAGVTEITYQGKPLDLTAPYRRARHLDLVVEHTGIEFRYDLPPEELRRRAGDLGVAARPGWGVGKIIAEVFEKHVERRLWDPTFVTDYPKEISPLARTHREDPNLAERFELVAAGRELAVAFSELNDPFEQRRRFEEQARARAEGDEEAHPIDDDYVRALEYGLPPTGGLGIGVDRVVMLLADRANIRDVLLFPHLRPE